MRRVLMDMPQWPSHSWCNDDGKALLPHKDNYSSQRIRIVFKSIKMQFPSLCTLPQLHQPNLALLLCFPCFWNMSFTIIMRFYQWWALETLWGGLQNTHVQHLRRLSLTNFLSLVWNRFVFLMSSLGTSVSRHVVYKYWNTNTKSCHE